MPVVPTQKTRTVAPISDPGPFQNARGATADAFGGSVGRATEGLGGSIDTVAQEVTNIQAERNAREIKDLDVEFTRRRRELLYGNGTSQNPGFYSTRGQEAVDMSPVVQQKIEDLRQEILGRASNGNVHRNFNELSTTRSNQTLEQIARFTIGEQQTASLTTSQARIQEAIDDAVVGGITDDTILAQSLVIIRSEVLEQADIQGWAPEVTQSKIEEAQTALFQGMITASIRNGDMANANRLFEEHRSQMDGPVAAQMAETLRTQSVLAEVQSSTDQIMALSLSETEALAEARQIENPQVRKEVVADVKRRYDEIAAARKEQLGAISADAHTFVREGGSINDWAKANPEEYNILAGDGPLMRSLQSAEDAAAERRIFSPTSNGETLASLLSMSDHELAVVDPIQHRHMLTESEFNKLVRATEGAKAAVAGNTQETSAYFDGRRLLREMTLDLNWGSSKAKESEIREQNALTSEMDAFISGFVSAGQPPPTFDQMRAEALRLSQEARTPGAFGFLLGGDSAFIAEVEGMSPEQQAQVRVDVDDIDERVVENVKTLFTEETGNAPTTSQIEEYLGAWFMRDSARMERLLGNNEAGVPLENQEEEDPFEFGEIMRGIFGVRVAGAAGPAEAARGDPTVELPPVNVGASVLIAEHEGKRNSVYLDSLGIPTIGIGFNLQRKDARARLKAVGADIDKVIAGEEDLTDEQISVLFQQDVQQSERDARDLIQNFDELSPNRQQAFIDMAFNLGKSKLANFRRTLEAANRGDWQTAADEAQNSLWFKQVGRRGPRIVELIRNG